MAEIIWTKPVVSYTSSTQWSWQKVTLSRCRFHWAILSSSSQSRYIDLNAGSEAGVFLMFYHIKIVTCPFKSKTSLSKAQQECDHIFHGGNWLRSRLVTLLLNPIPWHSQDQVIVKSCWIVIKSGSDLVDRLLAKRDLRNKLNPFKQLGGVGSW